MKIIVDAMGGDNAPKAPVMGAIAAAKAYDVEIILVGQSEKILECLKEEGIDTLPPRGRGGICLSGGDHVRQSHGGASYRQGFLHGGGRTAAGKGPG